MKRFFGFLEALGAYILLFLAIVFPIIEVICELCPPIIPDWYYNSGLPIIGLIAMIVVFPVWLLIEKRKKK